MCGRVESVEMRTITFFCLLIGLLDWRIGMDPMSDDHEILYQSGSGPLHSLEGGSTSPQNFHLRSAKALCYMLHRILQLCLASGRFG